MGLRLMWFSSVTAVLGAIIDWVLTKQELGIDLSSVGIALMVSGVIGFVASTIFFVCSLVRDRGLDQVSLAAAIEVVVEPEVRRA